MKLMISYFYQIRNFSKNMLPMSTAMYDPAWYHAGLGPDHLYLDKRGILNGLRLKPVIVQGTTVHTCPCETKDPTNCLAMKEYRQKLEEIDFDKMMRGITQFAEEYKDMYKIEDEMIMVLIVYETPTNPCSERSMLKDYFKSKGYELEEFQPMKNIKEGEFEF